MPTFNGTAGDDTLNGSTGNDTINGLGGNDEIHGRGGADVIDAGDGNDSIWIDGEVDVAIGDQINGGTGEDTVLIGGRAADDLSGRYSIANVTLTGVERLVAAVGTVAGVTQAQLSGVSYIGGDFFLAQSGVITLTGLTTNSNLTFELNPAGNQLDLRGITSTGNLIIVNGSAVADTVFGSSITDSLNGGGGNDLFFGGAGSDFIIGGDGDDTFVGGAGADSFYGEAGRDTLLGTAAELNTDFIAGEFPVDDRIVITDATLAGFSVTVDAFNNKLFFTGGTITLGIVPDGTFVASAALEGGVQINLVRDVENDFNRDGRSDILWRNVDGTIGDWLANENGSFTSNGSSVTAVPNYWHIAGTGDFNGDGYDDILWRGDGGEVGTWLGGANGTFAYNAIAGVVAVPNNWQIVGLGDFNGDRRDDILWRNSDGTVGNWLANADGSFTANNANVRSSALNMHVAAIGDFDGNGMDEVLWRDTSGTFVYWIGSATGAFFSVGSSRVFGIGNDWHIIGAGDFNGDGRDDILWRHDDGTIANWQGEAFGWTPNDASVITITNDWHIVGIGDYNGDGRDDILWRHDSGTVGTWLAREDGTLAYNAAAGLAASPSDWHVEDRGILMV